MPKAKVISYADKCYQQKKSLFDIVSQVFEDMKLELNGPTAYGWNKPVQELQGITCRLMGETHLELTYHRFEVATVEDLARSKLNESGAKFLEETSKELKKRFKEHTGKALKLKKVKEDRGIDKHSRLQADTSWMLGSNRYGHGSRPVGRYLVRDSCVYEFSAKLL